MSNTLADEKIVTAAEYVEAALGLVREVLLNEGMEGRNNFTSGFLLNAYDRLHAARAAIKTMEFVLSPTAEDDEEQVEERTEA